MYFSMFKKVFIFTWICCHIFQGYESFLDDHGIFIKFDIALSQEFSCFCRFYIAYISNFASLCSLFLQCTWKMLIFLFMHCMCLKMILLFFFTEDKSFTWWVFHLMSLSLLNQAFSCFYIAVVMLQVAQTLRHPILLFLN